MNNGMMEVVVDGKAERRQVDHVRMDDGFGARRTMPMPQPVTMDNEMVFQTVGGQTIIIRP